jgi:hypothetical protein
MGDVFKEQIVKREKTFQDTFFKILLWVAAFFIGFLVTMLLGNGQIGLIALFAACFGAKFLSSYMNIEYEYVLTNGELDIDIIYDQSRRKRVFNVHLKQVELMAFYDDKNHQGALNSAQETRDFSSGKRGPNSYALLVPKDGKKFRIFVEPNEKMLKAFSAAVPRNKFHLAPGVILK